MLFTDAQSRSYGRLRGGAPAWLDADQKIRWERLRLLRMLFEGDHVGFFLRENRTQFDYPDELINGEVIKRYLTVNLMRLMSLKTADLMFAAKAQIDADNPAQSSQLKDLARRTLLHSRLHTAAVQSSWSGGGFLESCLWAGEGYLQTVEPDDIYPIGSMTPAGQYSGYVRFATANVGTPTNKIILLLETTYTAGQTERRLTQLDAGNNRTGQQLALDQWPAFVGDVPPDVERTGLNVCAITYLPNVVDGRPELSDYDPVIHPQDSINAKTAQIARVLAKHADPKLFMPETSADAKGNVLSRNQIFYGPDKNSMPQYITWSAELGEAMQDRDASLNHFCMVGEISQILLGLKQGATPDAARKLRLECTNTLAKISRKVLVAEPIVAQAIETTQRIDQTSSLRRSYPVNPLGVHLRDGLPIDPLDLANEALAWRGAKGISTEGVVGMRIEDPIAAAAEVTLVKAEEVAAMPFVLSPLGGETPAERDASDPDALANDPQAKEAA